MSNYDLVTRYSLVVTAMNSTLTSSALMVRIATEGDSSRVSDGTGIEEERLADTTQEPPVRVAEDENIRIGEATPVALDEFFVKGIPHVC